jgi:excinuclease ABC subunit A
VIKTAGWVIDLGPEGSDEIVAWSPPENIAKAPRSHAGKFLAPVLARDTPGRRKKTE